MRLDSIHIILKEYIGEDEDKVAKIDIKKFTQYFVDFIDSLEYEEEGGDE